MMLFYQIVIQVSIQICIAQDNYITRKVGDETRTCIPYYNCPPGNAIFPCVTNYKEELCSPCFDDPYTRGQDYVQPDYISSHDSLDLKDLECFKPIYQSNNKVAVCTGQDIVYSKTRNPSSSCIDGQGCKCDLNKCYYGDPCLCRNYRHDNNDEECEPGYHLDNSGNCVPCPEGTEKKERGCGPCFRVKSNSTISKTTFSTVPSIPKKTTTSPATTTKQSTTTPTTTTASTSTVKVIVSSPKNREQQHKDNTVSIIIGVVVAIVILVIIGIIVCILHRKGHLKKFKSKFCRERGPLENEGENIQAEEEMQPLNRQLSLEQQDNLNNMNFIGRNDGIEVKPDNNNIVRTDSECPSERFNSGGSVSLGRQLSNLSSDRINSNTSESNPLIRAGERYYSNPQQCLNRLDSSDGQHALYRSESVPQQVSQNSNADFCESPSFYGSASRLVPSPTGVPYGYMENGGGACIPPPDFSNIQSSSPVMNTELPNIIDYKRSLSKDSTSSVEMVSSSPFSSIPEETGKEIQDEVAETNISTVVPEPPHISDVNDYTNCHISQFSDLPQASDITNQIDSHLEQYNHTVTGEDDGATCSVQRLPSEHEEETMKKRDLESNLDSGMVSSKDIDSGLSSKSDNDPV